ncbi:hypothetical protein F0562_003516 [Nyssa sinensis]|uniref:MACPF domain-containing protein n=1 Tax=Nyssa sinensis TaxID=561372 RepID=A0A5J5BZJ7_9ASTE|nr:hypothetical protein F0562_003516 [Nyssa sinensis]
MGGKDIVYVKQQHSSPLEPADVQKRLKDVADQRFSDVQKEMGRGLAFMDSTTTSSYSDKEDITFFYKRRGGNNNTSLAHKKWCQTVQLEPDVISMSLIPISSLLGGIHGNGFLSHAINVYLRYKPPIEELYQFLEFQLPRQWAPVFGELAVGPETKQQSGASLQFSLMGPKLHVNTNLVDVGKKPVTGLRLYLEGKRSNCLAIHLQHLSSLPKSFQLQDEPKGNSRNSYDRRYYEKVQWKSFSHICTAPVESDDDLSVVTGAEFEVKDSGLRKVLFLRLHFSKVIGAIAVKRPEWDGSPVVSQKSGIISSLISTHFSTGQKPPPQPADVNINSAVYPGGPPVPSQTPKLLRFIDTTEMTRGPQDLPGYWVLSGARLMVDRVIEISTQIRSVLVFVWEVQSRFFFLYNL